MVKGIVFDIQRFSLHDGPGIRTTVFLKGCPLRCMWCHNPESQGVNIQLSFKSERCVYCGACEAVCPEGVHKVSGKTHTIDFEKCTACGKCIEACAYDALKLYGTSMEVSYVINEVLKDKKYYDKSGGGITISGGEPLQQPDFTYELLKASKESGIHTCIETTGFAPESTIERLMPYVDLFLFDYKATNHLTHKRLIGASNELILSNFKLLYDKGASIILRCPLISGINDDEEHLNGIARLCNEFPLLKGIQILPYHDMGKGKYKELGKEYSLTAIKNTDDETKKKWLDYFISKGCKNIKIG